MARDLVGAIEHADGGGIGGDADARRTRSWGTVWSRPDPEFAQRVRMTLAADGRTIDANGEMSRQGAPWEPDLCLRYTRTE